MSAAKVVVVRGERLLHEPRTIAVEVTVNGVPARCKARFGGQGTELLERGNAVDANANVWWAVKQVMLALDRGESLTFPLDVSAEVEKGPWS